MRKIARAPLLAGVVLTTVLTACAPVEAPLATDGTLDLRSADLDRPLALKGEWKARASDEHGLLLEESGWRNVSVPGYFEAQGFPDNGSVWYRLELRLPSGAGPLRGFVQHANNSHAIYLQDPDDAPVLLARSGQPTSVSNRARMSRAPVTFSLPADTSIVLLWQIANHDYLHGGAFYPIYVGSEHAIDRMLMARMARAFLLLGIFVFIGMTFLLYWWAHRTDVEALAVSLLSFVMSIRVPVMTGALELFVPAIATFEVRILLEAVTFLLVPGLIALLLWYLFPLDMRAVRIGRHILAPEPADRSVTLLSVDSIIDQEPAPGPWRTFNTAVVATSIVLSSVLSVLAVFADAGSTSWLLAVARWTFVPLAFGALILLAQVLVRRRPMALTVTIGTAMLVGAGVHDIFLASGVISGTPYLGGVGFLAFVLAQTYGLLGRFAQAADEAREDAMTLQDVVSERTRELRAATIAAQSANLAKSHFLSAVSHELRSPLASILGYNRILQEELREHLEPQHLEFFDTIRGSGERLTGLVNDILDVAKIEAGLTNLVLTRVDARRLAADIVEQLAAIAREKHLDVRLEMGDAATRILADPVRLRQVLLSLISNAIKFTRDGQVTLLARESALNEIPACAISVVDTGPGISAEFLPVIFDRFTQDETLYSETQRGTGLGLTIARELVVRMDGKIEVESEIGQGSTFTITLPLAGDDVTEYPMEIPYSEAEGA